MTLEKAIEINEENKQFFEADDWTEQAEAVQLGIEALKAWKEFRGSGSLIDKMLLPGETEE